jgi:hypothetical protein
MFHLWTGVQDAASREWKQSSGIGSFTLTCMIEPLSLTYTCTLGNSSSPHSLRRHTSNYQLARTT